MHLQIPMYSHAEEEIPATFSTCHAGSFYLQANPDKVAVVFFGRTESSPQNGSVLHKHCKTSADPPKSRPLPLLNDTAAAGDPHGYAV